MSAPPVDRLAEALALAAANDGVDARKARVFALEARELARRAGDEWRRAEALHWEGRALGHLLEHDAALAAFREALAITETQRDDATRAKLLRAIGFTCEALGDFSLALDHLHHALEIDEAAGNAAGRAATLRTIGIVYSKSGDPETGLDYFERSLAICKQEDDDVGRAKVLNDIGVSLNDLRRHEESLAVLTDALELFRKAGFTLNQSGVMANLGLTLEKLGRTTEAEATLAEALALSEATGYGRGVIEARLSLGRIAAAQGRTDDAQAQLSTAVAEAERCHLQRLAYECHEALAALHEKRGEYREALLHHQRFHTFERAVLSEMSGRQMKLLQMRYPVAAAQREAQIRRLRRVELAHAYAELEERNRSLRESVERKSRLVAQLERQTLEDSLTGLGNRRLLDKRFADEFDRAIRHGRPLAVAIVDIDRFKRVNDRYSHAVGDAALKELARLLSAQVRHTDLVARFGGEEFVIVLVETPAAAAEIACEKIRVAVATHDWTHIHPRLALTISIGFCADTSLPGCERMLAVADRNLYIAKAQGRNRVVG